MVAVNSNERTSRSPSSWLVADLVGILRMFSVTRMDTETIKIVGTSE